MARPRHDPGAGAAPLRANAASRPDVAKRAPRRAGPGLPASLQELQRAAGNRAVQRLLAAGQSVGVKPHWQPKGAAIQRRNLSDEQIRTSWKRGGGSDKARILELLKADHGQVGDDADVAFYRSLSAAAPERKANAGPALVETKVRQRARATDVAANLEQAQRILNAIELGTRSADRRTRNTCEYLIGGGKTKVFAMTPVTDPDDTLHRALGGGDRDVVVFPDIRANGHVGAAPQAYGDDPAAPSNLYLLRGGRLGPERYPLGFREGDHIGILTTDPNEILKTLVHETQHVLDASAAVIDAKAQSKPEEHKAAFAHFQTEIRAHAYQDNLDLTKPEVATQVVAKVNEQYEPEYKEAIDAEKLALSGWGAKGRKGRPPSTPFLDVLAEPEKHGAKIESWGANKFNSMRVEQFRAALQQFPGSGGAGSAAKVDIPALRRVVDLVALVLRSDDAASILESAYYRLLITRLFGKQEVTTQQLPEASAVGERKGPIPVSEVLTALLTKRAEAPAKAR
jgi:hypothetical protein